MQKQELVKESTATLTFGRNLVLSDSSKSSRLLQIKPKGLFSYSVKDGFVGEAEELMIETQEVNGRSIAAGELITATNKLTDLVKNESVEKTRSQQVERSGINSIWIFLLLILLILFFVLSKKFRIF
ncbi:hypothetical protein [Pedobacter namyangjuensis]|uniref:hypothetical protein n=1 Tax=Pedobacter namyangjuensis TaxID=600626 RepID=UPI0013B3C5E8|nr:hypothetical protein [Pedobacter namyangjuensis]